MKTGHRATLKGRKDKLQGEIDLGSPLLLRDVKRPKRDSW